MLIGKKVMKTQKMSQPVGSNHLLTLLSDIGIRLDESKNKLSCSIHKGHKCV